MREFQDKVALVTGATAGIGRATAIGFARAGAAVVVAGRSRERGEAVVSEITGEGGRAVFQAIDIAEAASVRTGVQAAGAWLGRLDYAVNNAGVEQTSTLLCDTDDEEMHRIIDTDLKGTWLCLKSEAPLVRAQGGAIVNMSSFWGEVGMAGGSSYAAAKGGIIALTRAVAAEEAAHGVRVNCVSPGAIQTPMLDRVVGAAQLDIQQWAKDRTLIGRVAAAEEVADLALFLCSSKSAYMTGQNLLIDGGYTII